MDRCTASAAGGTSQRFHVSGAAAVETVEAAALDMPRSIRSAAAGRNPALYLSPAARTTAIG
jgi:hypothetical protein